MTKREGKWREKWPQMLWPASLIILPALFWWQIAFADRVLAGIDLFTYFYPLRDYTSSILASGHLPLWNPYLFLGVPLLANIQAGTFYPLNLLFIGLPAPIAVNWSIIIHLALAGLGVYAYARKVSGLSRPASWIAGALFALGGFLSAQAEHVNQLNVSAWFPWLLLLFEMSLRKSEPDEWPHVHAGWAVLLTLLIATCFLAGHTQAWYISLFGLGLYALGETAAAGWKGRNGGAMGILRAGWRVLWPRALLLGLGAGIALALSAIQLLPTLELSQLSIRGGGMTYREVVAFSLKPQLMLRAFTPGYGETLFSEYVAYIGWGGVALVLVGLLASRRMKAWWVGIGLSAAGIFLAFGGYNPFYYVLYKLVPGFSLFRVPARWLLLYAFGAALLAGVGLDAWRSSDLWVILRHSLRRHHRAAIAVAVAGAIVLAGIGFAIFRGWMEPPSSLSLAGWAGVWGALAILFASCHRLGENGIMMDLMLALVLGELFFAGRALALASPTAWDAYASLRTAPAHILAAGAHVGVDGRPANDATATVSIGDPTAHWGNGAPTFRFISMSGIRYDPGDLADIHAAWDSLLPDKAIYDFIVATKQKEVLAPNLPLLYRIASVDGYDGGVLPLKRYVTMQSLLLEPAQILPDGRLREQLEAVPPARLLALLNVEYVITDKVQDVWIDDTFYDLQFSATLGKDALPEVVVENPYTFIATELGIIAQLDGAAQISEDTPVATVSWIDPAGRLQERAIRAGDVNMAKSPFHPLCLSLGDPQSPGEIHLRWAGPAPGRLLVRGLTLIDPRSGTNRSLVVSGEGRFRLVHSGDVKIYRNLDNLPRAYIVGRSMVAETDEDAIAMMRDASFDPGKTVVLHEGAGHNFGQDGSGRVEFESYAAGEVVLHTESNRDGYLVLTDAYYPGWEATIDGAAVPILRANVMFRAVELPAGAHRVVFRYAPESVRTGKVISLSTLGLLAFIMLIWWLFRRH